MMTRLQELSFAMKETELFLDGHPTNRRALAYLRDLKQEYDLLRAEYETTYAPLTPRSHRAPTGTGKSGAGSGRRGRGSTDSRPAAKSRQTRIPRTSKETRHVDL